MPRLRARPPPQVASERRDFLDWSWWCRLAPRYSSAKAFTLPHSCLGFGVRATWFRYRHRTAARAPPSTAPGGARYPCVTPTRLRARIVDGAQPAPANRHGRSTKPRSSERRRRVPRIRIQPETKAVDAAPNRRDHGELCAEGGAITSAVEEASRAATPGIAIPCPGKSGCSAPPLHGRRWGRWRNRGTPAHAAPCPARYPNSRARLAGLSIGAPPRYQ